MTNSKLRALGTLLASTLFFVVSCSSSSIVAGRILIELDARDIVAGDEPHRLFYVLAVSPDEIRPVLLSRLEDHFEKYESVSLLLTPGRVQSPGYSSVADTGEVHYIYNAVGLEEQSVELQVTDYDHFNGTYHYLVRDGVVTPTYSR